MPKLTNVELLDTLLDNEIKKAFDELKATIAAMEEDLSKAKSFTSVKDLMADLNADD